MRGAAGTVGAVARALGQGQHNAIALLVTIPPPQTPNRVVPSRKCHVLLALWSSVLPLALRCGHTHTHTHIQCHSLNRFPTARRWGTRTSEFMVRPLSSRI